jgi:hypothetical protein
VKLLTDVEDSHSTMDKNKLLMLTNV